MSYSLKKNQNLRCKNKGYPTPYLCKKHINLNIPYKNKVMYAQGRLYPSENINDQVDRHDLSARAEILDGKRDEASHQHSDPGTILVLYPVEKPRPASTPL